MLKNVLSALQPPLDTAVLLISNNYMDFKTFFKQKKDKVLGLFLRLKKITSLVEINLKA